MMAQPSLDVSVPLVGAPALWGAGFMGEGMRVAVLDTGIDAFHLDLDDLDDDPATADPKILIALDFTSDGNPMDFIGHGTHVASTAAGTGGGGPFVGMAPQAFLWNLKVCQSGGCPFNSIINAIGFAALGPDGVAFTDDEAHVINMSLGGPGGPDDVLSLASDAAVDLGVSVAVSAGNSGPGMFTVGSPGTARKVTTVAASDDFDAIAGFSSRGPVGDELLLKPDIAAPGVSIRAAALGGGHVDLNGTSMASPHVAGASALVRQAHPDWDPGMVKAALMNNSLDLGDRLWEQGAGRLRVPQAADTMVIATPPSFSFGTLANGQDATGTLTLWNVSDAEVTVELTVETTVDGVTPSDAVSVAPPTLTIPPRGTAEATVMAGPIDPGDPAGWYESRIMADINPVILGPATHELIHVPLLFYVEQAPIIVVSSGTLTGDVVEAEILGETLTIANTGSGQLEFRIRARAVPEPLAAVATHPAERRPWADQPPYAALGAAGPALVTPSASPRTTCPSPSLTL